MNANPQAKSLELSRQRPAVMADVARLADVSYQTVSRVLHDSPNVRPVTRERVLAAIRQLDYRPNIMAQALVTGHSRTLGVVSFDTTLYGPASTLLGIEQAAHGAGYAVSIASLQSLNRPSMLGAINRLQGQGVEGIIVVAPLKSAVVALGHLSSRVPMVAVEGGGDRHGQQHHGQCGDELACELHWITSQVDPQADGNGILAPAWRRGCEDR